MVAPAGTETSWGIWTKWVAQARSRGFPGSAVRGEAGGLLTPEARTVLRGASGI